MAQIWDLYILTIILPLAMEYSAARGTGTEASGPSALARDIRTSWTPPGVVAASKSGAITGGEDKALQKYVTDYVVDELEDINTIKTKVLTQGKEQVKNVDISHENSINNRTLSPSMPLDDAETASFPAQKSAGDFNAGTSKNISAPAVFSSTGVHPLSSDIISPPVSLTKQKTDRDVNNSSNPTIPFTILPSSTTANSSINGLMDFPSSGVKQEEGNTGQKKVNASGWGSAIEKVNLPVPVTEERGNGFDNNNVYDSGQMLNGESSNNTWLNNEKWFNNTRNLQDSHQINLKSPNTVGTRQINENWDTNARTVQDSQQRNIISVNNDNKNKNVDIMQSIPQRASNHERKYSNSENREDSDNNTWDKVNEISSVSSVINVSGVSAADLLTTTSADVTTAAPLPPMVECVIGSECSGPRGKIIIPKFTSGRTLESQLQSAKGSFIRLRFEKSSFNLQRNESTLTFGNGLTVKENIVGTVFGEMYSNNAMDISSNRDVLYFSSNTNSMWLLLHTKMRLSEISYIYFEVIPYDSSIHVVVDAQEGEIKSPGFPNPYPSNVLATWKIDVGNGYGIDITVAVLDVDGSWDDYLLIAEGDQLFEGNRAGVLSWHLEHIVLRIPTRHQAYIWFRSQNHAKPNEKQGFKLSFKRYGNLTITTTPIAVTTTIPRPPPDIQTNLTLFAIGKSPQQFVADSATFQKDIALIAGIYCRANNISLNYTIEAKHVMLNKLQLCHCDCEENDICVRVTFSVIAFSQTGYALPTAKLQDMMKTYGHSVTGVHILLDFGKASFKYWLFGAVGSLAVLMLVFLMVWRESRRSSNARQHMKFPHHTVGDIDRFSDSHSFDVRPDGLKSIFEPVTEEDEGIEFDPSYGTTSSVPPASPGSVPSSSQLAGRVISVGGSYVNWAFSDDEDDLHSRRQRAVGADADSASVASSPEGSVISNSAAEPIPGSRPKIPGQLSVKFCTDSRSCNTAETAL